MVTTTVEHHRGHHPPDWELFRRLLKRLEAFRAFAPGQQEDLAWQLKVLADNLREYLAFRDDVRSPEWLSPTLDTLRSRQVERIRSVSLLAEQARDAGQTEFANLVEQAKAAVDDVCAIQAEKEAAFRRAHEGKGENA
jgi:hypothetical protein